MTKYVIHWVRRDNASVRGNGTQAFDRAWAAQWAKEMNSEYPMLYHYIKPVNEWRDYPPHSPAR